MSTACPTRDEIDRFLRSTDAQIQADPRLSTIEAHVLGCQACIETMEGMIRTAIHPDSAGDPSRGLAARAIEVNSVDLAPQIEGFVVGDRIGRGGMGTVFKAWQSAVDREVAIKVLPGGPLADSRWRAWCLAEARAAARVRHADVVQIHNVGVAEGYPYLVMEYIAGGSLANRLRKHPTILPRDAARLLARVARAVHHMHLRGIIHRDLKPGNILIDSPGEAPASGWRPKVADFGLARSIGAPARSLTLAGIGTPEYMAPEQARGGGEEVGIAADVYALGAILYHLLVGRPPFQEASPLETIARVIEGNPTPPHRIAKRLPRDLETIVLKCLERDPRLRYASAETLADDLELFLEGRTILARPIGPLRKSSRFARRHPVGTTLMIGLAITSAAAIGLLIRSEAERSRAAASEALALDRTREAERRRIEAEANRQEAEQMFEAAGSLLAIVGKGDDLTVPRVERSLAELEAALPACRELLQARPDDRALINTLSSMIVRLGQRKVQEDRPLLALELLRDGAETIEAAFAASPDDGLRLDAATMYRWQGRALISLGEYSSAIRASRKALGLCGDPAAELPLTPTRLREAFLRTQIGNELIWGGATEEGRRALEDARIMLEGHLAHAPDDINALSHLANAYRDLGASWEEIETRRRIVCLTSHPNTSYALAATLFQSQGVSDDESPRQRASEIVALLEPVIPGLTQQADEAIGNPDTAGTLHWALAIHAVSLLDLGRVGEATVIVDRLARSVEDRIQHFPKADTFVSSSPIRNTFYCLGRVTHHPALPESTFQLVLGTVMRVLEDGRYSDWDRAMVVIGMIDGMSEQSPRGTRARADSVIATLSEQLDQIMMIEEVNSNYLRMCSRASMSLRVVGRLDLAERIVSWCGQELRCFPDHAKHDLEYHIALSEYWREVAKNLWQHEPLDEQALGEALRESLAAAEEAARLAPEMGVYRDHVAERRARLERSGLNPELLAQDASRTEVALPHGR